MGITGLLPMLKPIQVKTHLSELKGQTLGVDAYVWLHRGVYGCASELATGKQTVKYVNFAMERVRLLRHHNIEPYFVFDGGPLPAKKGTETERRERRAENMARGKQFTARGQHSQARECYVKAVDVSPQMAYQLIKALKSESVSYVVAPYEADAQLAYLERAGIIDGIITEDSDLLVFGCKRVFYKLDTVDSSLVSISRSDFTSIDGTAQCNGVSLVGWSDAQFRAMAILSGCDYLPSISGIGLKTAWSLLKKHKSVEAVVRSLRLDGKKSVPKEYLRQYKLAEACFLHQRVFDPRTKELVHLMPITDPLDKETNAYVGGELECEIARRIAVGDFDPNRLIPMVDICSSYQPKALGKVNVFTAAKNSIQHKGASKPHSDSPAEGKGLLKFFTTQNPPSPTRNKKQATLAGRDSGKRKLADAMVIPENGLKRRKSDESSPRVRRSRYFASSSKTSKEVTEAEVILISSDNEKENLQIIDGDAASDIAEVNAHSVLEWQQDSGDEVVQEDGYHSASSWDAAILSSPIRKPRSSDRDLSDTDHISSPPAAARRNRASRHVSEDIPTPNPHRRLPALMHGGSQHSRKLEPINLKALFDEVSDVCESESPPTVPPTQETQIVDGKGKEDDPIILSDLEEEDDVELSRQERHQIIGDGWRNRWAYKPPVKASVTSTPRTRHHAHGIKFEGPVSLPNSAVRQRARPSPEASTSWTTPKSIRGEGQVQRS